MKSPQLNRSPRLRTRLIVVLACCFQLFGMLVWHEIKNQRYQALDETDLDILTQFVVYQIQKEKDAPTQEVGDMQLMALDHDVEAFRAGAVKVSDTKGLAALPEVTPGAFQDFFKGEISAKFPAIWPYVIAGSITTMGNALGAEPVVAFYNPYFDVAILSKWKFVAEPGNSAGPGFKLMQAFPVTGRAFVENRVSQSTDQPVWADSEAPIFEVGIVKAAQSFLAAFEERYPPFDMAASVLSTDATAAGVAVALIEDRVFYLLKWVIDAQDPKAPVNYAAGINELRAALAAASPVELAALLPKDNPQEAEQFFRLDHGIREGMLPYLVVGQNVIFVNPEKLPKSFLSVYFEPKDEGYRPALMALFNLGADYPVK